MILIQHTFLSAQSPRVPVAGDIVYAGFDAQSYYSVFFDKDQQSDVWNLAFLKSPYISKLAFAPAPGIVNGKRIDANLMLTTHDGQKFYYKSQGENIYLKYAQINSEMTKSGLMWVEVEGSMPEVFPTSGAFGVKYIAQLDKQDLDGKYAWLAAKGEKYLLEITYRYSHLKNEKGTLDMNNTQEKATSTSFTVNVSSEFNIWNKGKKEAYPLNPFLWPGVFKNDIALRNFLETRIYTDSYVKEAVSFKSSGRQVSDVRIQSKRDTKILESGDKSIIVYPNPTFGEVFFDMVNYPKAKYRLEVYNVVGAKVYSFDFPGASNSSLRVDLSHLNRGIYQFVIFDSNDKRLTTQRVNIVYP